MIVMCVGSTLICRSRTGIVQRATAPKPTNRMRFEKVAMKCASEELRWSDSGFRERDARGPMKRIDYRPRRKTTERHAGKFWWLGSDRIPAIQSQARHYRPDLSPAARAGPSPLLSRTSMHGEGR